MNKDSYKNPQADTQSAPRRFDSIHDTGQSAPAPAQRKIDYDQLSTQSLGQGYYRSFNWTRVALFFALLVIGLYLAYRLIF
jgi:hypothetical protein